MIKKDPYYRVTVYSNEETIIVEYPITCKFSLNRGLYSQSSKCTIQLYNLAPATRNKIFQDVFTLDWYKQKYVHLEAGYGGKDNMSVIFKGRILQAYSHKAGGQTDVITKIQAQALDIFDCQTSHTFAAGTSYKEAYRVMSNDLPGVSIGNIGTLEGTFKSQTTFDGNAFDVLNTLTDGHTFVDNGILNTIMDNEVIDVPVPVITDSSGLLETPVRRGANLDVKMLFEPSLIIGQLLEIKSVIQPIFNGQFKVLGFSHDCLISPTQAGTRTTTANLWIAPLLPSSVISVTGEKITEGEATGAATPAPNGECFKVKGENVTPLNPQTLTNWIMPCKGRIVGYYGEKRPDHVHNGIDIAVPIGTPVKAVADGWVVAARPASGYGKYVVLEHSVNGKFVTSEYGHISSWCVSYGQKVKQGQIIAYSGNEGHSQGPHCHLTIREGKYQGKAVNPYKYINPQ